MLCCDYLKFMIFIELNYMYVWCLVVWRKKIVLLKEVVFEVEKVLFKILFLISVIIFKIILNGIY